MLRALLAAVLLQSAPAFAQPADTDQRDVIVVGVVPKLRCEGTFPRGDRYLYSSTTKSLSWNGQTYPVQGSDEMNHDEANARDLNIELARHGLHIEIGPWLNEQGEWEDGTLHWLATRAERKLPLFWGVITATAPAPNGLLVAWHSGEWGGGLEYLTDDGRHETLIDEENVHAIFDLGGHTYALAGLSHLGLNNGSLWRIDIANRKPTAQMIAALPGGMPDAWSLVDGKAMLVATVSDDIAILPDGRIEAASSERACIRKF